VTDRSVTWGGLHNARDLGGLPTGMTVTRPGRVFRTPRLDGLDEQG
jgi:protein-tyrosine phosphatase